MNVAELLNAKGRRVVTAPRAQSVKIVMHQMTVERIGSVVIVEADSRWIDGIISERDIVRGMARYGQFMLTMSAAELMTRSVRTCTPRDTLKQVMETMTRSRIRHLPVVDELGLCGVVSIGDVVKCRLEESVLEANVLRDLSIVGRTASGAADWAFKDHLHAIRR